MKLLHVHVERFRGLREVNFGLTAPDGRVRNRMLVLGDNGAGKTTLLQAISLPLALATRKVNSPTDFPWYGFIAERTNVLGPTRVVLDIAFDDEEITTTKTLFEKWRESLPPHFDQGTLVEPGDFPRVQLQYSDGQVTAQEGVAARMQFLGRYYVKRLLATIPEVRSHFAKLGEVFWFDQFRNLGSVEVFPEQENPLPVKSQVWTAGVEQLRSFLVTSWSYHVSPPRGSRDYIPPLQERMAHVFPGFKFVGTEPHRGNGPPKPENTFVYVERDGCPVPYDIAEMSSGEQGLFPLAYEIVRLDIAKSIIMIDELELHLHPPEQQTLYARLPLLAPDCQFLLTTHSSHLAGVAPEEETERLSGGRLCL